jgi:hypothetical protein
MDIKKLISDINLDPSTIEDSNLRVAVITLLNIVEFSISTIEELKKENQLLRDEINRLKGEQGKPNIRAQKIGAGDISSEKERKPKQKKKVKKSKKKKSKIKIHETRICSIDKNELPEDAIFKGYDSVVIQDILLSSNNVEFKKVIYYSPSQKKTYRGKLPIGYQGEFGPRLKTLILHLYHASNMSEPAILELLCNFDIHISASTISRMLIEKQENFKQEKNEIVLAGACPIWS